jgi:hypothetical protein
MQTKSIQEYYYYYYPLWCYKAPYYVATIVWKGVDAGR